MGCKNIEPENRKNNLIRANPIYHNQNRQNINYINKSPKRYIYNNNINPNSKTLRGANNKNKIFSNNISNKNNINNLNKVLLKKPQNYSSKEKVKITSKPERFPRNNYEDNEKILNNNLIKNPKNKIPNNINLIISNENPNNNYIKNNTSLYANQDIHNVNVKEISNKDDIIDSIISQINSDEYYPINTYTPNSEITFGNLPNYELGNDEFLSSSQISYSPKYPSSIYHQDLINYQYLNNSNNNLYKSDYFNNNYNSTPITEIINLPLNKSIPLDSLKKNYLLPTNPDENLNNMINNGSNSNNYINNVNSDNENNNNDDNNNEYDNIIMNNDDNNIMEKVPSLNLKGKITKLKNLNKSKNSNIKNSSLNNSINSNQLNDYNRSLNKNVIDFCNQLEFNDFDDFNPELWRLFYPNDENFFNFDKGNVITSQTTSQNKLGETETYIGDLNQKGEKHGFGKLFSTKRKRIGTWRNNKFMGWGREVREKGDVYEGKFIKDKLIGKGIYKNKKILYIGDFYKYIKHGKGDLFTKKIHYKGYFYNNKFCGKGRLEIYNQGVYDGKFRDNEMNGKGTFMWKEGDIYQGEMKNGIMEGEGKLTTKEGIIYEGTFKDGLNDGYGIITYPDGEKHIGRFSKGILKSNK